MLPVRVAVLDRRPLVREVLAGRLRIESGIDVVVVAAEVKDLAAAGRKLDVVLLGSADRPPTSRTVRIVPFSDQVSATELIDAVCGRSQPDSGRRRAAPQVTLTERERHVLGGVADGLRSDEIATSMCITRKSVENHKQRIFAKLGVQSQAHAVAVALEAGPLPRVGRQSGCRG